MVSRKLPSFIEILPGELFVYTLSRFLENYKSLPTYKVYTLLFDNPNLSSYNLLIPPFRKEINQSLGGLISEEEILSENSIYNLISPFYDESFLEKLQNGSGKLTAGFNRYSHKIDRLRYCPSCIKEDLKNYQIPYVHSLHHLPGLSICPYHHEYLKEYYPPEKEMKKTFYTLKPEYLNLDSVPCYDQKLIKVSNLELELFNTNFNEFNLKLSSLRLKENLIENHYDKGSRVDYKTLFKDFTDYYKNSELIKQFFQKEVTYKIFQQELYRMLHQKLNVSPIKWLMMIGFLSDSVNDFYYHSDSHDLNEYYFGSKPWVCYNPASDHYLEKVIENLELHFTSFGATGVFKCQCGMYYSQVSGSSNINILQYGKTWMDKLEEYLQSGFSQEVICEKLNISRRVLKNLISNKKEATPIDNKVNECKENFQKFLEKNPNAERLDLQTHSVKDYNYLLKYDRKFLDELLPVRLDRGIKIQGNSIVDWSQRDEELCQRLPEIIQTILNTRPPIRISYINVFKFLNGRPKLEKLPMFRQMLEDYYENSVDFNIRRLTIFGKEILLQGNELDKKLIKRQISHKNKDKDYILDKVYQNLKLK